MLLLFLITFQALGVHSWDDCDPETDGHAPFNSTAGGPFKHTAFLNTTWNKHIIYVLYPDQSQPKFPLLLWMHGLTGQYEMNQPALSLYASHGFVIMFPFILGPEADTGQFVTNTNGKYLLNALEFAGNVSADPKSPLYNRIDMSSVVVSGHSMGATCSIEAATTLASLDDKRVKLVVAQHPGLCGPFGPPPWPSTWLPKGFASMNAKYPVLMTTATNDNAFLPAPTTALHETQCYNATIALATVDTKTSIFVEYSDKACQNDHARDPFDDSGHNCAFKTTTETPWMTTAIKYYAHLGANPASKCHEMLFGQNSTSFLNDANVQNLMINFVS